MASEKVNKGGGVARWFRELGSELKKVSWATFGEVLKKTGIVLVVVLAFLVLIFLFDIGVGKLYELLVAAVGETGDSIRAVAGSSLDIFRGLF